jgi:DnaK suppressor protein
MDATKIKELRQRLSNEYQALIQSLNRNRLSAQEIQVENTEDESDLASASHDKYLLYNLNEGGFFRLRFIQEAINAIDHGQYGECMQCSKDIDEKRLDAVPWATMCIHCQEETEMELTLLDMITNRVETEEIQLWFAGSEFN